MNVLRSLGHRYVEAVRKFYFYPGYAQSINVFRVLFCCALIARILADSSHHDKTLVTGQYNSLQVLDLFGIGLMSPDQLVVCRFALLTALGCAVLGLFTRTALTAAWLLFILYFATMLGFTKSAHSNYVNHSKNICVVILCILSAAPAIGMWGVDGLRKRGWKWKLPDPKQAIVSAWATQLIKLTLGMAYFGSGYTKFIKGGIMWADGHTLQAYLLNKHLLIGAPLGAWLSQHYWLCVMLGVATLVLELTFFLIVFFPRLTWFYVFGAMSLHKSIEWIMKINFLPYFGYAYFIFLDWPTILKISAFAKRSWNRLQTFVGRTVAPVREMAVNPLLARDRIVGETTFSRRFVIGMGLMLLFCVICRIERWPLTDYRVYANRHHYTRIAIYRMASIDHDGNIDWLERKEMTASPTTLNRRFRHATRYEDESAFEDVFTNEVKGISPEGKRKFKKVAVIKRTVEKGEDGQLHIKNEIALTKPLQQERIERAPVMQAWYEQTYPGTVRR